MLNCKCLKILVFFLLMAGRAFPQDKWTLNQCILYAIENNSDLRQFDLQEQLAKERQNQSVRNLLPGVRFSSNAGLNFGRVVDPNTNGIINTEFFNNSYNLNSSIVLFDGFRLQAAIQYEKFREKTASFNQLNAIDDLAFSVMDAYYNVIYFRGMLEIAKEQVEASGMNMKATEKKYDLGLIAKSDFLEMKANLEAEELNKVKVENSLRASVLTLKQRMNFSEEQDFDMEEEVFSTINSQIPSTDQLFDSFIGWSPYYQSFVSQLQANKKNLALSRSELFPSINATWAVNTGYFETRKDASGQVIAFEEQLKNNKSQYLGLSLSIPLFAQWNNRSNVKLSKLNVELAEARLESEKQKLYFEMTQNLDDLEAFGKEYIQYQKQKEADELAYQAAEKKLGEGLLSVIDFYVIKNRYATTQSETLRAKLQLEMKRKALDFYGGKRFWEIDHDTEKN